MRTLSIVFLTTMLSSVVLAEKPPTDVNVINQPLEVMGMLTTSIANPVTVNGNVDANVSGTVNVVKGAGITHYGKSMDKHVQLQAAEFPIASAAILSVQESTPNGGGTSFEIETGECLVITELDIAYINAGNTFPVVGFRLGLTDAAKTSVLGVRLLRSIPDTNGNGKISKTFPSGLILTPGDTFPENVKLGLETFDARVVDLAASGYVENCAIE